MFSFNQTVDLHKAAGEPTRLRLLVLCQGEERSVTELAIAVDQSEPRVSRHLKQLAKAGLVTRARRGQWVCYRTVSEGDIGAWLDETLARLDTAEPVLQADRERTARAGAAVASAAPGMSRLGRALAAFGAELPPGQDIARALVVEPAHLELVDAAAAHARRTTVVAGGTRAREVIREHGAEIGEDLQLVARVPTPAAGARNGRFDLVVLDLGSLRSGTGIVESLHGIRAQLTERALLWICLPYDALERMRGNVVEHPIAGLRRELVEAGLEVERLSPIEAGGHHILTALARSSNKHKRVSVA